MCSPFRIDFFCYAAELMKVHPPHPTDWSTVARLRRIGIEVGESFNPDTLDPAVEGALSIVPGDSIALLHRRLPGLASVVDGWQSNVETWA